MTESIICLFREEALGGTFIFRKMGKSTFWKEASALERQRTAFAFLRSRERKVMIFRKI